MTARLVSLALLGAGLLAACGAPPRGPGEEPPPAGRTAGAEDPAGEPTDAEAEAAARPVVLRSTVPVPVPQPAVPRDDLSAPLERVWTRVEEQVSDTRPDGPEETTVANVQAWADGPFRAWIETRRVALEETRALLGEIPDRPPYERAIALALWAYAFEDFGAQIASAPVPEDIARDDELRGIYIESLNAVSLPLGERAVELYADCQTRLAALGDDSPWLPWRAYCVQRGQEVIAGYGLAPDPGSAPAGEPAD